MDEQARIAKAESLLLCVSFLEAIENEDREQADFILENLSVGDALSGLSQLVQIMYMYYDIRTNDGKEMIEQIRQFGNAMKLGEI